MAISYAHFEDEFIDNNQNIPILKKFVRRLNLSPKEVFYKKNISVKYDGRFSLFTGWDNGDFFVSTKKIFNVNPVIFKTNEEIDKSNTVPYVKRDLKLCLKYLKECHRDTEAIYQADFFIQQI